MDHDSTAPTLTVRPIRKARRTIGFGLMPVLMALISAALLSSAPVARAADGCLVLLCLAAPSWSAIPQCVDPVRQVLRDLARGRPFPTCSMSGDSGATSRTANPPGFCPPQYTHVIELESGAVYGCEFSGAVEVQVQGLLWARLWWAPDGRSVTEYTDRAKAALDSWDTRFDDDYRTWSTSVPLAPPPSCTAC